jgi:hypothetical protein
MCIREPESPFFRNAAIAEAVFLSDDGPKLPQGGWKSAAPHFLTSILISLSHLPPNDTESDPGAFSHSE